MESAASHNPVMADEVTELLHLKKGLKVLDATLGCGGHANFILNKIQPDGLLIGIDCDASSLKLAENKLNKFNKICKFAHANFKDLDKALSTFGIERVDAALFDLGISTYQLLDAGRGFSFGSEAPLDMRMDHSSSLRAHTIVNKYRGQDLEDIIRDFGQERYYRRIVRFILERRGKAPINTTRELSELIRRAVGGRYKFQKIHPATRTFQALRIAVNTELDNLQVALGKILDFLSSGARLIVISFHSLEDRIVKVRFKEFEKEGRGRIITKKPVTPKDDEIRRNPRSRSAKLRVFENHRI